MAETLTQDQNIAASGPGAVTGDTPEVQQQMAEFGINEDVAIGNVMMQQRRDADAASVVTSQQAEQDTRMNQEELQKRIAQMQAEAERRSSLADGTVASETDATGTQLDAGVQGQVDILDQNTQTYVDQLDSLKASVDDATASLIEGIKASAERARAQMKVANANALGAKTKMGVRSGRQRYAAEIQTDILTEEQNAGIQRLLDIDAQEKQLIAEAQMANSEKQLELLNQKMGALNDLQKEKISLLQDQQRMGIQMEQLAIQKAQESRAQAQFEFDIEEDITSSLAASIAAAAGGVEEVDFANVQQIAQAQGVDANRLYADAVYLNREFKTQNMASAAAYQSIAGTIPAGEFYTDPLSGMTFKGTQDPEEFEVTQTVGNTDYRVRFKMNAEGNPEEMFRISLGPRWQTGTSGSTTTDSSDVAMDEAISGLLQLYPDGNIPDGEIEWTAEQLSNEYGVDFDVAATYMETRIARETASAEDVVAQGGVFDLPFTEEAFTTGGGGLSGGLNLFPEQRDLSTPQATSRTGEADKLFTVTGG